MRKIYQNYDWQFKPVYEEVDLKLGNYEGFTSVNIPHTNQEVPVNNFDSTISNKISIYKKNIMIDSLDSIYNLVFEGVGHLSYVYVNGILACTQRCGYLEFTVTLNPYAHIGDNEIAVVVDSNEINQPPFGFVIDYLCFGGIYRDVYLDVLNPAYITDYYLHHTDDTYFLDYKVSKEGSYDIKLTVSDGTMTFSKVVSYGDVLTDKLPNVKKWDIDNPYLYTMTIELIDKNGNVLDIVADKVGFRKAEFKEDGFYLNNKKVKLRGLNRHQSYPYVGYAMPARAQIEDAEVLKNELFVNAVRTSHYPQSRDFLRACDELGLLVFEEIPGWQHVGKEDWQDIAVKNVYDMITRDKQHPSIILWGVRINESGDYHDFYTRTNEMAHKTDPYRSTGGVRCSRYSELLEDVYTYNDFINTNKGIALREKNEVTNSNKPYLVSEYGGHMYPTKSYDNETRRTEVALIHSQVLKKSAETDEIAGTFGWCAFDYNTHLDFGSGDLICHHGVCDIFRNPKYTAYPYKTFQHAPYLEVTSNFNIGEHNGGYIRSFAVMTNCDKVEMIHNGMVIHTFDNLSGVCGGCFECDDLLGNILEELEHKTKEEAIRIKEIIKLLLKYDGIVRSEITDIYDEECVNEAWQYYGKYASNWGSHPTPYTFKGYKQGMLVKEIVKGAQHISSIKVTQSTNILHTSRSYDTAKITIEAIGNLGNRVDYAFDCFSITTTNGLEIIGEDIVSLNAGIRSFWVKTKVLEGNEKVTISSKRFGVYDVHIKVEK